MVVVEVVVAVVGVAVAARHLVERHFGEPAVAELADDRLRRHGCGGSGCFGACGNGCGGIVLTICAAARRLQAGAPPG